MAGSPYKFALKGGMPAKPQGNRANPGGAFVYPSKSIESEAFDSTTTRLYGELVRLRLDAPEAGKIIRGWLHAVRLNNCLAVPVDSLAATAGTFVGDGDMRPNEFGVIVDTGSGRAVETGETRRYSAFYQVSGLPADVLRMVRHPAVAEHSPIVNPTTPRNAVGSGAETQATKARERKAREFSPVRKIDPVHDAEQRLLLLFERGETRGELSQENANEIAKLMEFLHSEAIARDAEKKPSVGTGRAREMRAGRNLSRFEHFQRKVIK